jgi:hypothetical protein
MYAPLLLRFRLSARTFGAQAMLLASLSAANGHAQVAEIPAAESPAATHAETAAQSTPITPPPPVEATPGIVEQNLLAAIAGAADDLGVEHADIRVFPASTDLLSEAGKNTPTERWRLFAAFEPTTSRLTLLGVAPNTSVMTLRSETIHTRELDVRVISMTRDLVRSVEPERAPPAPSCIPCGSVPNVRSPGRATLALHAALVGAYLGYSIERAGGSSDARLTYPLMALGTGLGIGAAMVVADEWDVGYGDAWFLSAGTLWPTTSALLLADGYNVSPASSHFVVGLAGTAGGLTLASLALSRGHMSDGAATLAHSGGAFGLLLGGLGEMTISGKTDFTPLRGTGYGAAGGVLLAGTIATFTPAPTPSRVLLIDLSAGLGALTGAAAASPLAIGNTSRTQKRIWLGSIAAGTIGGALVGYFITKNDAEAATDKSAMRVLPFAQVAPGQGRHASPELILGVQGTW